jgi:hypothetical protein
LIAEQEVPMSTSNRFTANVASYTVRPEKAEALREAVQEHLVAAARRVDGYRGFLLLDQGNGKRLGVVLYDSAEHARAAQQPITAAAREHGVYEMMAGPNDGSMGTAVVADGVFDAK